MALLVERATYPLIGALRRAQSDCRTFRPSRRIAPGAAGGAAAGLMRLLGWFMVGRLRDEFGQGGGYL